MKSYTCIVCPRSCVIELTLGAGGEIVSIDGANCKRGEEYVRNEYTDPKRMVTTTVGIEGAALPLLPVISSAEIPKRLLNDCLRLLYSLRIRAPVKAGDVIAKDVLNSGVDILAARDMESI